MLDWGQGPQYNTDTDTNKRSSKMSAVDIINEAQEKFKEYLENNTIYVRADDLGLDKRAGSAWIDKQDKCIVVASPDLKAFQSWAGFAYIDDAYIATLGSYTVFSAANIRVEKAINFYRLVLKM